VRISIVVAAAENGVIGANGRIPWRLPADQQFFKQLTLGHCIVMGRGTFESIGRLLPGRTTIVMTRDRSFAVEGAVVAHSFEAALEEARTRNDDECFVVGGAEIYRVALPVADRLFLTRVAAHVEGDVRFPDFEGGEFGAWALVEEDEHPVDARHAHAFRIQHWERKHAAPNQGVMQTSA
jgi:dihydrofolate reductase